MWTAVVPVIPSSARLSAFRPYSRAFSGRACMYGSSICTTSAPGGEEVADLLVHRGRVVHRGAFGARVEVVLRLLRHRERAGHRDLHPARRVALEELQVLDLDRVPAADLADDARHRVRVARAVERRARVVDVDAVERGGEAVGVALAPDLAVGDDVEPGFLLRLDRHDRRVVLRLGEERLGDAPQLLRPHPRREPPGELLAVDQPLRLRVAADERRREQHLRHGLRPWNSFSRPTLIANSPSYMKTSAVAKVSP